jgi:hypothetical protein
MGVINMALRHLRTPPPPHEPSYTIPEFCAEERMSVPTYYKLRKAGLTPDELRYLNNVRITYAARLAWHKRLQSAEFAEEIRKQTRQLQVKARDAASKSIASAHHVSNRSAGEMAKTAAWASARKRKRKEAAARHG